MMNREMELNLKELEQVNGGIELCIGGPGQDYEIVICGFYSKMGMDVPPNYCEAGVSPQI